MKKKPVVLALNRGRYLLKPPLLEEWCLCLTPLEPFIKDNNPRQLPLKSCFKGIPTPFPTWGGAVVSNRPLFTGLSLQF